MKKRVLFLHTGGTLGMVAPSEPGPLEPAHYAADVLPYVKGLEDLADIEGHVVANIDSSDMEPASWERIAVQITKHRERYDGFVVLHGTDTMAFSASALSYMLRGLDRPVVLTGSQRPLADVRTDARLNLIHATLAATLEIPEVCICFSSCLFRGNRARKMSIQDFDAFESPNCPALLEFGVDIVAGAPPRDVEHDFQYLPGFDRRVAAAAVFPGADPRVLDRAVDDGTRAVLLTAFGDGNVPAQAWPEAIERATGAGTVVGIVSQAQRGVIKPGRYVGSARAREAGACFAGDMTFDAAITKLMWLLHQERDPETVARRFSGEDIAGELTLSPS